MASGWYHLKHRKPVAYKQTIFSNPIAYEKESRRFYRCLNRFIRRHNVGDYSVYTSFLGLDHGDDPENPLLFETMIFSRDSFTSHYCFRTTTHRKALAQHRIARTIAKTL